MPERVTGVALATQVARSYATNNMVSAIRVERMAQQPLDPVDKSQPIVAIATLYEGPARIAAINGPDVIMLGGGPQVFSAGYMSIPLGEDGIRVGDIATVTSHQDPMLVGRCFRVTDVQTGTWIAAVRRMQVLGIDRSEFTTSVPDPMPSDPAPIPASWLDL
jgi:hypothetical protein